MKCLNEYQLECLIENNAGLKALLWRHHVKSCQSCQEKFAELESNLSLQNDIMQTLDKSRKQ